MLKKLSLLLLVGSLLCGNCWAGVEFDGDDDYISYGDPSEVENILSTITVACWINFDNTDRGDIIGKWSAGKFKFVLLHGITAGKLRFFVSDSCSTGTGSGDSTTTMSAGTWYHVAGTFDKPDINGYINGVVEGSTATETNNMCTVSEDLEIGRNSSDPIYFDGKITECAIWDTVLTTAELQLLASSRVKRLPLQIQPNNLVWYSPMDDVSDGASADGDTFNDLSGNGNTGTGDDGANNTGLLGVAETVLTY